MRPAGYMHSRTLFFSFILVSVEVLFGLLAVASPLTGLYIILATISLLLMVKPEYILYVFVLSIIPSPCLSFRLGEISLSIACLISIILILSWITARLANTRPPCPKTECDSTLLLFWAWALLSLFWSQDLLTGYEDIIKLSIDIAVIFLVISIVRDRKILHLVMGIFIFVSLIDAMLAIYYPYTSFFVWEKWHYSNYVDVVIKFWVKNISVPEGRGMGFFTAHGTAVTLSMAIAFGTSFFYVTKNATKRSFILLGVVVLFLALVCTMTKSLIISVLCGAAYVSWHLKPLRRKFLTVMITLLMLTVLAFVLTRIQDMETASTIVAQNVQIDTANLGKETSLGSRIKLFKIGIQKLLDTGGLGTGIGGFLQYSPYKQMDGSHPAILFDLGFIGFILWIWLLLGSYRLFATTLEKCKNEYFRRMLIIYLGGYVNILISWFVTFSYADIYIWFYLGVGFALVHMARNAPIEVNEQLPFFSEKE